MADKRERLFQQDYPIGYNKTILFSLYREDSGPQRQVVTLTYRFTDQGETEIPCKRFFYDKRAAAYESPYLSWYNLICCSNEYGPIPVVDYMNYAVQNGKKIAATIYPKTAEEYLEIIRSTQEGYYCVPYNPDEYQYLMYLSRTGRLADYFDFDQIMSLYDSCGVSLNRDKMREYFDQELDYFGNPQRCGIELHNSTGDEERAVVGLLFGYPLESTVAFLKGDIDLCQ